MRRLRQLGVSEEQADRAVELIAERVPATRPELASHLAAHDIPVEGQAIAHLVHRAALRGRVALTPDRVFVPSRCPRRATATPRSTSSPAATPPATRARPPTTSPTGPACRRATCARPPTTPCDAGPVPRVALPAFDELLLGWRDRTPTVPAEFAKRVHPGGGILRAVILEDGVAVGTWSARGETLW